MTSEQIDRVFGRGRLQMVTGAHVEVFREAAAPGERRRYTKRFLTTADGDYAQWTEREWRILARLIGHGTRCVPDVVQYDRDARGTKLVQTYDAGATVDQWATLLPVERGGRVYAHVFEDCAHWWALAHHCLVALDEIHTLHLVHLDVKGDNICIPIGPANLNPAMPGPMFALFRELALIDFAFSLVSGETLTTPLPIGWQPDYDYQSPRLLHALEAGRAGDLQPTEDLDWRCDMYSLAAMLKRYLPGEHRVYQPELTYGWTAERYDAAKALILRIREAHDCDLSSRLPHSELITQTSAQLGANELAQSLERGWMLAREAQPFAVPALPLTPVTRLAPPIRLVIPARDDLVVVRAAIGAHKHNGASSRPAKLRSKLPLLAAAASVATVVGIVPLLADTSGFMRDATRLVVDGSRTIGAALRGLVSPDAGYDIGASEGPVVEPRVTRPNVTTAAAAESVEEVAGAGTAPSVGEPANDARPAASTPLSEASVAATKTSPMPSQSESPRTSPPAESSQSTQPVRSSSAASSRASLTGDSLAGQIEAYRSKPVPRSTPIARMPSTSTPKAARASNAQPVDSTRRMQLARTGKTPRPATDAGPVASRAQPPLASKRIGSVAIVAATPMPARTPPISVSSSAASGGPAVQPTAPMTEAKAVVATSSRDTTTIAGPVTQDSATPPSPAQGVPVASAPSQAAPDTRVASTPSSTSAAVTFPIAAPDEAPRASPAPNTVASPSGAAPIVEPSRTFVAPAIPAPRQLSPPPVVEVPRNRPAPAELRDDSEYLEQARWTLASVVPRTSAQTHAQIERVLWAAANAHHPAQERAVIDVATSAGIAIDPPFVAREIAPREARRFHEEARHAYWSRRHVPEAFDLGLKAFGANPNDPEIAGHLAFLHLKLLPAQPERARQLALHAIGMRNAQYPTGRADDWTTFAIASALTGRRMDARHALYAYLALTRNLDRSCRTALNALATYGDRMREPVEALLYRLHSQGRADDSPYCSWSPSRSAGSRYP